MADAFSIDELTETLKSDALSDALANPLRAPDDSTILRQKAVQGLEKNPDKAASDYDLSKKTGVPPGAISDDTRPDIETKAKLDEFDEKTQNAPATRDFFTLDELGATLAGDDIDSLVDIERTAKELTFTGSFSRGVDMLQQMHYRFVEAQGEIFDAESLKDFGAEGAERNLQEIEAQGQRSQFVDIKTAEDFFQWLKETGGEQIPIMAPSFAGGAAGAALGTLALPGIGTILGGALGVFIPSFIFGVGETQQAIKERDPTVEAPLFALGGGALIGLLDSALPGKVGSQLLKAFGREAAERALVLTATRIARRAATQGAQGMAIEGVTEAVQEVISEAAAARATDTEIDAEGLTNQVIEAFAAGAFLGGGVSAVSTATTDTLNMARQRKNSMDRLNNAVKKSKLQKRAPEKMAEFATETMREAGVDKITVPVEVVLKYAQNHPTLLAAEALDRLGVNDSLSAAVLPSVLDADSVATVDIETSAFAREILGTDSYALFAPHISFGPDLSSYSKAAEAVLEDEKTPAALQTELEAVDVSDELRAQTKETLAKLTPGKVATALDEASPEVRAILNSLIQKVQERKSVVGEQVKAGRIEQLDVDIDTLDRSIVETQEEIDRRETENRDLPPSKQLPVARLQAKVDRLVAQRDALVAEQRSLASAAEETIEVAEKVQKEQRQKPVKVKAKVLQDLDVQTTKEAIRATRAAFREGLRASDVLATQKKEIVKAINQLPISQAQKKLLANRIQNARTAAQLNRVAGEVQSRATVLTENTRRREIKQAIEKVLKRSQPKKVSGKKVGGDPEIEAVLERARSIIKKPAGEAQIELDIAKDNAEPAPEQLFERRLLAVAANSDLLNTTDAENLLLDLNTLSEGTKGAAFARITGRQEAARERIKFGIEAATRGKPAAARLKKTTGVMQKLARNLKQYEAYLAGTAHAWDDVLDISFNKRGVDAAAYDAFFKAMRMTDVVQNFKARGLKWHQEFIQIGLDAFELQTEQQLHEHFLEDVARKDYGLFADANGEVRRLEYSVAEIRKLWMEDQDPTLHEVIVSKHGMAFTPEMLNALFDNNDKFTPRDRAFAEAQLAFYRKIYPAVNAVYRRIYGIDLPFNEFYSPIQRDKGQSHLPVEQWGTDLIHTDEVKFRRQTARQLKERIPNLHPLLRRHDVGAMQRYLHDMAWFVETAERVQDIKSVFKNEQLLSAIAAEHPGGMTKIIHTYLEDYGTGYAVRGTMVDAFFGYANRAMTSSQLPLKTTIGAKQVMSHFAMMDNVPAKAFMAAHADFFKSPENALKIIRFLYNNSPLLQTRGSSPEFDFARISKSDDRIFNWKKGNLWNKWIFSFIRFGDRVPVYVGGWAVYKNAIAKGKSHSEAIAIFEDAVSTTQQSNDIDKMSLLQRSGDFARSVVVFMTARLSLLRGELRAIRQFGRNKISAAEFGKRMAAYHFAIPMLVQWVASGYRWETDRQLIAAILGQFNAILVFGDAMNYALIKVLAAADWIEDEVPAFSADEGLIAFASLIQDATEGAVEMATSEDLEEFFDAVKEFTVAVGALAGQPLGQILNIAEGLADTTEGEAQKGILRIGGHSEKVAEEAADAE